MLTGLNKKIPEIYAEPEIKKHLPERQLTFLKGSGNNKSGVSKIFTESKNKSSENSFRVELNLIKKRY
jgi:hypothetical protein